MKNGEEQRRESMLAKAIEREEVKGGGEDGGGRVSGQRRMLELRTGVENFSARVREKEAGRGCW